MGVEAETTDINWDDEDNCGPPPEEQQSRAIPMKMGMSKDQSSQNINALRFSRPGVSGILLTIPIKKTYV